MLDMRLIRDKSEEVRENIARRRQKEHLENLDKVLAIDEKWRQAKMSAERLKHKRNETAQAVARIKDEREKREIIQEMKQINDDIEKTDGELMALDEQRKNVLLVLPNLLHESVPEGQGDAGNVEIRRWGAIKKQTFTLKSHVDLIKDLDLADIERASKTSGARFYYLKNDLFRLGLALTAFTIDSLAKKGFTPMETPFMLRRDVIQGAIALSDFEDVIYKVENEDLYLIATAEHALLAYHMNELLDEKDLPKCYCGYSTNFRKEAGAHGKDTRGIFRVHQFDKVEQFVFCSPEDSWEWHEKLLRNAEEIYQALEIPYRVVNICTGDIGTVAAKKYDIEAWMPAQNTYREVVSCSNCTDYQARRLNIRYRLPHGKGNSFVHTLNSTAIAIQRTLVAILENYQQEDETIAVPDVLQPYARFDTIRHPS